MHVFIAFKTFSFLKRLVLKFFFFFWINIKFFLNIYSVHWCMCLSFCMHLYTHYSGAAQHTHTHNIHSRIQFPALWWPCQLTWFVMSFPHVSLLASVQPLSEDPVLASQKSASNEQWVHRQTARGARVRFNTSARAGKQHTYRMSRWVLETNNSQVPP